MKRFFKWAGIVVGALALLLIVTAGSFIGWLKCSGEQDWKRASDELRAKGEKLSFAELVPPIPPDSKNFFADPLWAGYSDLVRQKQPQGEDALAPRLPNNQQPLYLWESVPLSAQESDQLAQLLSSHGGMPSKNRQSAVCDLRSLIHSETNLDKKKKETSLMLQILTPANEMFARIATLSKRPQAQFPLRYDLLEQEGFIPGLISITNTILELSQWLMNRASCELLVGKNDAAAADTETLLRLSFIQKNEPLLISHLVSLVTTQIALELLNQGITDHAWNADQLKLYQVLLEKINLPKNLLFVLRGERINFHESLKGNKQLRSIAWYLLEKDSAYHALILQEALEKLDVQIKSIGWNFSSTQPFKAEQAAMKHSPIHRTMYMLAVLAAPVFEVALEKTAECQTQVEQSLITCALERYRLARGVYPASLDLLIPNYLAKLPDSAITGKPMSYSRQQDGTFLLWSPGWKLKSLDGKPGKFKGEGDVVWDQPLAWKQPPALENKND